jgi:hypothetical protein
MNFGFAGPLTEEGRRADLRAGAVVIAELVFSAMSLRGPSDSTTAAALQRQGTSGTVTTSHGTASYPFKCLA